MVEGKAGAWKDIGSGLVKSEPNPYNTRQYMATLTKKGREAFNKLEAING
jgi:DNA-binding MarR family transcriptional regulator